MKVLIVYSHITDGKIVLENATETIDGPIPSIRELIDIKRRMRQFGGYQNVAILNWFEVKEE